MKTSRLRDALWLALGLAILANSRPFEGLVVSIPAAVVLGIWIIKSNHVSWRIRFCRVVLPVVLVLLLAAAGMGFYNFRVTGNPFLMPYQVYESTYGMVPVFLWQPSKPEPHYNHMVMQKWQRRDTIYYVNEWSLKKRVYLYIVSIPRFWLFFFGILFIPPMLFLAASRKVWRRRNVMFPLAICALLLAALMTETWFFAHYAAPVTCLCFLLMVESLRQVRRFTWRGKRVGQLYVWGVLPMLLASAIATFALAHHLQQPSAEYLDRARILRELEHRPGSDLVIVRYSQKHNPGFDWVFNRADIDGAKVVWAREMGPQADKELLAYFKDRRVWLLQADQLPPHLIPYPDSIKQVTR